jgi:hypothetical protein
MNFEQSQTWRALSNDAGNYYCRASESERELFRDWIKSVLTTGQVQVTFDKADGTERTMPCTLKESLLPKTQSSSSRRKYNEDICVVFDPERQVWRSFRWDRLKRVELQFG